MTEDVLSAEERQMVESFPSRLISAILPQSCSTEWERRKNGRFFRRSTRKVTTKDLGEVGDLLENVVKELKSFDAVEEEKVCLESLNVARIKFRH